MKLCCCMLAGTVACKDCANRPLVPSFQMDSTKLPTAIGTFRSEEYKRGIDKAIEIVKSLIPEDTSKFNFITIDTVIEKLQQALKG